VQIWCEAAVQVPFCVPTATFCSALVEVVGVQTVQPPLPS
jgi:hypothetical protein